MFLCGGAWGFWSMQCMRKLLEGLKQTPYVQI